MVRTADGRRLPGARVRLKELRRELEERRKGVWLEGLAWQAAILALLLAPHLILGSP